MYHLLIMYGKAPAKLVSRTPVSLPLIPLKIPSLGLWEIQG